ncbi:MAG: hypothetical protein IPN97_11630 [Saprospiraceae bacterium]|nr:hypothetical protein [Saprospiraceae bacterium]
MDGERGNWMPTGKNILIYNNKDIEELAKIFSGLNCSQSVIETVLVISFLGLSR